MDERERKKLTSKQRWYRRQTRDEQFRKEGGSDSDGSSGSSDSSAACHSRKRQRVQHNESNDDASASGSRGDDESRIGSPDEVRVESPVSSNHDVEPQLQHLSDTASDQADDASSNHSVTASSNNDSISNESNGESSEMEDIRESSEDAFENNEFHDQHTPQLPDSGELQQLNLELNIPQDAADESGEDGTLHGSGSEENQEEDYRSSTSEEESHHEDEEDDENEFNYDNERVFNGAHISFKDSAIAILTFILSHKLTGLCVSDLLLLLSLHCGPENLLLKTLHNFKKYFKMVGKNLINCHYYCANCEIALQSKTSLCTKCGDQTNYAYFIEFPIGNQLEHLFARPGFYDLLQFRFNRTKKNADHIEEIYDGSIYQQLFNSGFLRNPNHLSFFMYFDGISLYKSSNFSLWPVYLTINELRFKDRTKRENTVLAGIWFGKSKPNPNLFLQPIHDSLLSLERDGINITLPSGENITVRSKLLGVVGDMPAKALFMRLAQYNGAYSCFLCMEQGGRYDLGNATIQVFPYRRDFELRTNDDMIEFAGQAVVARQHNPNATVYGVKGPSLLSSLLPNLVHCMAIDVMHGVFLGVMKTLMNLWFDPQYSQFPYSVSNLVNVVDSRLKNIKPPSSFHRGPRSIKSELAKFKASDFKLFFFYFSVVVLSGILPEQYWIHHCKLVTAVSVLCAESISREELQIAEELIHAYVHDFQELYGLRHLSLTFHQLLHLPLVVSHLGPAWIYSCFFYESLNGQLARLVHGTRYAALQICSSAAMFMKLPVIISSMHEGPVKEACLKFQRSTLQSVMISENIDNQSDVVGKLKVCYPVPLYIRELLQFNFHVGGGRYKYFYRLKKNGIIITSESYVRCKQKESCFVEIFFDDISYFCKIKSFLRWSSCGHMCPPDCENCAKMYLCVVTMYERDFWELHDVCQDFTLSYINKVTPMNETRIFEVESIRSLCLHVSVDGKEYICLPVNTLEIE